MLEAKPFECIKPSTGKQVLSTCVQPFPLPSRGCTWIVRRGIPVSVEPDSISSAESACPTGWLAPFTESSCSFVNLSQPRELFALGSFKSADHRHTSSTLHLRVMRTKRAAHGSKHWCAVAKFPSACVCMCTCLRVALKTNQCHGCDVEKKQTEILCLIPANSPLFDISAYSVNCVRAHYIWWTYFDHFFVEVLFCSGKINSSRQACMTKVPRDSYLSIN